jgi:hypothetical protein
VAVGRSAIEESEEGLAVLDSLKRRGSFVAGAVLLAGTYAAVVLTAVLALPLLFTFALLAAVAADTLVDRRLPEFVAALRRVQFGLSHRAFVLAFAVVLLAAVSDRPGLPTFAALALAVPVGRVVYLVLLRLVRRRIVPAVEVRNLHLPQRFLPVELPPVLVDDVSLRMHALGALAVLGGALSIQWNAAWLFGLLVLLYLLVVVGSALVLVRWLLWLRRQPGRQELLEAVSKALRERHTEVVLYFSGSANATYQVDMWLPTLSRMRRRAVVLLRERHAFEHLARTDVPVVCVPNADDLMSFALPDVRVAFYVAHSGKNVQFLREPRVKSVFIGHGDSDKVGSFSPFSKAYDQIWVAGAGGRDRYARAKVGVRDDAIVEVGRPQLDSIERRTKRPVAHPDRPLTVLYAPTWEGWNDEEFQTSLTEMGPQIVRKLLNGPIPVRLVYKPHPLTGSRDVGAREIDERIRALIAAANGARTVPPSATARLAELVDRLGAPDLTVDEEASVTAEWVSTFWSGHAGHHLVVTEKMPTLFDCFNAADLLIADVSSVVSDFIASGKPYVVANPMGLPDAVFRETFPSSRAAYLLHPGAGDLGEILDRIVATDPLAAERDVARAYLLGPDKPTSIARWDAAVDRLVAEAELEWAGVRGAGPVGDPAAVPAGR